MNGDFLRDDVSTCKGEYDDGEINKADDEVAVRTLVRKISW